MKALAHFFRGKPSKPYPGLGNEITPLKTETHQKELPNNNPIIDDPFLTVTEIPQNGFPKNDSITQVTIICSPTSLPPKCFFNCRNLRTVSLPTSITILPTECFEYCASLTSIQLHEGLLILGEKCFFGCQSLKSISLPSSLTEIQSLCFFYCGLEEIFLHDSVANFDRGSFQECNALNSFYASAFLDFDFKSFFVGNDSINRIQQNGRNLTEPEWKSQRNSRIRNRGYGGLARKPVIYIYPKEEIEVEVSIDTKNNFDCVYPSFSSGNSWLLKAKPSGELVVHGRKFNSLFWEARSTFKLDFSSGFIVTRESAEAFLEDKLAQIGLTDFESNEFISYWLPVLIQNQISLVSFQFENYSKEFPLVVNPAPDSFLRVFLAIRKSFPGETVQEQIILPFIRKGYCVVEWGGCEAN